MNRGDNLLLTSTTSEIIRWYNAVGSVNQTADICECSQHRVIKTLSSNGIIINKTHEKILDLHNQGLSAQEIAVLLERNVKTVQAYLPRVRKCIYGECSSRNARNIKRHREKQGLGECFFL